MDDDVDRFALPYDTLLERGTAEMHLKTGLHDRLFQITEAEWSADLDAGTITFTSPKGLQATAPVQIIGTYNMDDETWLWAWDNPSIDPAVAADANRVREYGERHAIDHLTARKLEIDEAGCWDLVAVSLALNDAQGAFSGGAGGPTLVYLTFGEVCLTRA